MAVWANGRWSFECGDEVVVERGPERGRYAIVVSGRDGAWRLRPLDGEDPFPHATRYADADLCPVLDAAPGEGAQQEE